VSNVRLRWLLLLGCACACFACGGDLPKAQSHGLEIEELEDTARGDPVPTYTDVRPGRWKAVIVKSWVGADGDTEREGHAVLHLDIERRREDEGLRTYTSFAVVESGGLGRRHDGSFDGLRVSVAHDEEGRPDPDTLRFEAQAPPEARSFLRGFWLGGLAGATPWLPAGSLRTGQAWPRASLGPVHRPDELAGAVRADLGVRGGGRLEDIAREDGEARLELRLETLVDLDAAMRRHGAGAAVNLGIRDRGEATVRARDGLPIRWTLIEDTVLDQVTEEGSKRRAGTLRVQGTTTQVTEDAR
jgi:hypothetical protein